MPNNYLKKYLQCFWDEDLFPEQSNNKFNLNRPRPKNIGDSFLDSFLGYFRPSSQKHKKCILGRGRALVPKIQKCIFGTRTGPRPKNTNVHSGTRTDPRPKNTNMRFGTRATILGRR